MAIKKRFLPLIPVLMLVILALLTPQEQSRFSGVVVDRENNSYNLSGLSVSGETFFHCRLKDAVFTVSFEKIQSVAFPEMTAESPYKGYVFADLVMVTGNQSRVYLNLENYWLEGIEENFGVKVKFTLSEIASVQIVQPELMPTPSPSAPAFTTP